MRFKSIVASSLVVLSINSFSQQPAPKDWKPAADAWWAHVQYLASDDLQGRRTGTPGFEMAVQYVEKQFKQIGLKPAGTDGYRQPIELIPTNVDNSASNFKIDGTEYALGSEVSLNAHTVQGSVDAPMIFLGYGLHVPKKHVDDLAGEDVKGKVVVVYNAPPVGLLGPQRAYARIAGVRWQALHAAGAIGMIAFNQPRPGAPAATPATPAPGGRRGNRGGSANGAPAAAPNPNAGPQGTLIFADPALESMEGAKVNATLTEAGAEKLFTAAGKSFADLKKAADAGEPLPHFAIPGTLHATTVLKPGTPIKAPNVIGMLEGSDSKLKKEYIVISAHLDHLGIGRPVDGDSLYNGAMDNASGSASVIEVAKLLSAGPRPKRSILFICLMGEELGELGSQYFATKPTVPKSQVVANLNMDMYMPLFPLRYLEVQGLGESTLGNDARAVCQLNDVEVQFDKLPEENRFIRSDQVNFVKQGIPALAFKFGWTPGSPEMKTFNDWVATRYHKPSDDLEQPVDKIAAAQFTSILGQLATRVANAKDRPSWYPESSFAVAAK